MFVTTKDEDELTRLKQVVDYEGGRQLKTPRSVVRALDAVRFFWPPLREAGADVADLVWLQLIKDGNPALYRWIEDYSATAASVSLGIARVDDSEKERLLASLLATVDPTHFDDLIFRHFVVEQLPSVGMDYDQGGRKFKIFERVSEDKRHRLIAKRRLASPDHYRLYFALAGPSHALTQDDFSRVWEATTQNPDDTGTLLLQLHNQAAGGSLTKADMLLERLKMGAYEALTARQCSQLLIAFSRFMDDAYRQSPFDLYWFNSLWDRAEALVSILLRRLDAEQRAEIINYMFEHGDAIGWLTKILRHEIFAHGRYGDRPRQEEERIFAGPELDRVIDVMLRRYRQLSADTLFSSIDPLSLLFAWRQAGDEDGPRQITAKASASDEGFVNVLERLTTTRDSSDEGRTSVLKRNDVSPFLDYDDAVQRASSLCHHGPLSERAKNLLVAMTKASREG
ncbi:hypothetical protein [Rhizorhabdus dicambivorans]|uniref:Uncharacterized protein n=1 Tax=Rhizorhabdus dicambivorans TaxID=1850238 RepID=A0A2A4FY90_9SPHN|nr:hypothetical protein [Rhizorhabdus dicambivorans]ATE63003.1 hypothetical protein CMV14_00155 [Rhizorhabdus dicambivorans]PCE43180.1 hypothetical protein COO09_05190 [Rhizorhabdus dicambivorans]